MSEGPSELVFAIAFALLPLLALNLVAVVAGVSFYRLALVLTAEAARPRTRLQPTPQRRLRT